jgi:sugar lactone lactonase YvrE
MPRSILVLTLVTLLGIFATRDASAQTCPSQLLVSGFLSNNVYIYDACTGAFQRTLDDAGRLHGPQAIKIGPDGLLWVVAEESRKVQRYRADTFAFVDTALTLPVGFGATGIAFQGNGDILVSGYDYDGVRRFSSSGQSLPDAIAPHAAGLNGPDNGMAFGPDGKLYVPGYDSHTVVRYDPDSGQSITLVPSGSGALHQTRGILFEPGGETMLVTSEGSGKVLRFRVADGAFVRELITGLSVPTGIGYAPDGKLLVADVGGVSKYDPSTGAKLQTMLSATPGGIDGLTYLAVIPAAQTVDASQVGTQYFVTGTGTIANRTITVADTISTTGPAFGAAFDPAQLAIKRWGALTIEFTSCTTGNFRWTSSGENSAGFGDGAYPIVRLLPNELTADCERVGFANASTMTWIVGAWYGGPSRNGEGLLIDKTSTGVPFVAWFTYRPR